MIYCSKCRKTEKQFVPKRRRYYYSLRDIVVLQRMERGFLCVCLNCGYAWKSESSDASERLRARIRLSAVSISTDSLKSNSINFGIVTLPRYNLY